MWGTLASLHALTWCMHLALGLGRDLTWPPVSLCCNGAWPSRAASHQHEGCPVRCRYFPTILIVLLAVFNDGAMIALSKDRVVASPVPNHWDLKSIFIVGERSRLWPVQCSLPVEGSVAVSMPLYDPLATFPTCVPDTAILRGRVCT